MEPGGNVSSRPSAARRTRAHKHGGEFLRLPGITCSSQDPLPPHQLHSMHSVSIQCFSKTHKEPPPPASIQRTKIEYSLVTQDMPTTEHVIQVITGHAGCRGL